MLLLLDTFGLEHWSTSIASEALVRFSVLADGIGTLSLEILPKGIRFASFCEFRHVV